MGTIQPEWYCTLWRENSTSPKDPIVVHDWLRCNSPVKYSSLEEGNYTFSVRATSFLNEDRDGLSGWPESRRFVIDVTPPKLTLLSQPASYLQSSSFFVNFAANEPVIAKCYLQRGVIDAQLRRVPTEPSTKNASQSNPHLKGKYKNKSPSQQVAPLLVRSNIAAKHSVNPSPASDLPTALSYTKGDDDYFNHSIGNSDHGDISPLNEKLPLRITNSTTSGYGKKKGRKDMSATAMEEPDGSITVQSATFMPWAAITQSDSRIEPASKNKEITGNGGVNEVIPKFPSLGPDETNMEPIDLPEEPSGGFEFQSAVGRWVSCKDPIRYYNVSDGPYRVLLLASDLAGNRGEVQAVKFLIDTLGPDVYILSQSQEQDGSFKVSFSVVDELVGSGVAGSFCTVTQDPIEVEVWMPCFSPRVYELEPLGNYTVKVMGYDRAGNVGRKAGTARFPLLGTNDTWDTDTAASEPWPYFLPPLPRRVNSEYSITFSFGGTSQSRFECTFNDGEASECHSPARVQVSKDGGHIFKVRAQGPSGVWGPYIGFQWVRGQKGVLLGTFSPMFWLSGSDAQGTGVVAIECGLLAEGQYNPADSRTASSSLRANLVENIDLHGWKECRTLTFYSNLANGIYTFSARSRDAAGNVDPTPSSNVFVINKWSAKEGSLGQLGMAELVSQPLNLISCDSTQGGVGELGGVGAGEEEDDSESDSDEDSYGNGDGDDDDDEDDDGSHIPHGQAMPGSVDLLAGGNQHQSPGGIDDGAAYGGYGGGDGRGTSGAIGGGEEEGGGASEKVEDDDEDELLRLELEAAVTNHQNGDDYEDDDDDDDEDGLGKKEEGMEGLFAGMEYERTEFPSHRNGGGGQASYGGGGISGGSCSTQRESRIVDLSRSGDEQDSRGGRGLLESERQKRREAMKRRREEEMAKGEGAAGKRQATAEGKKGGGGGGRSVVTSAAAGGGGCATAPSSLPPPSAQSCAKPSTTTGAKRIGHMPEGWVECPCFGESLGKLVPCKVPLGEAFKDLIKPGGRFTPALMIQKQKALSRQIGLVIDLTNTRRYYMEKEWTAHNVKHLKIPCRGKGEAPDAESVNRFVFELLRYFAAPVGRGGGGVGQQQHKYVVVHCTHGFNRTGYMIINYLLRTVGGSVEEHLKAFARVRPPGIYKADYIRELFCNYHQRGVESIEFPPKPEWKKSDDDDDGEEEETGGGGKPAGEAASAKTDPSGGGGGGKEAEDSKMTNDDILGVAIPDEQQFELQKICCWAFNMLPQAGGGGGYNHNHHHHHHHRHRDLRFPGSQPVSLDRKNLELLRRKYYYVTWKADGTRYMLLITRDGVYLIDRAFRCRRVQMRFPLRGKVMKDRLGETHAFTLLDGEMVIDTEPTGVKTRRYLVYDLMMLGNAPIVNLPFSERWRLIEEEIILPRREEEFLNPKYEYKAEPFRVRRKDFYQLTATKDLLGKFMKALSHEADGLIFQCWDEIYVPRTHEGLLKWKYAHMNSVDFLLKIEKDVPALYLMEKGGRLRVLEYAKVSLKDEDPEKLAGNIIECSWNKQEEAWEFMRIRPDKTTPNAYHVYEKVRASIEDNITEEDLLKYIYQVVGLPMYDARITKKLGPGAQQQQQHRPQPPPHHRVQQMTPRSSHRPQQQQHGPPPQQQQQHGQPPQQQQQHGPPPQQQLLGQQSGTAHHPQHVQVAQTSNQ
ncbi:hypothetical protein CBR_g49290 [Chara braunii]|uniref:mRNA guanylyltransferase n=1 Tax=Chara braunii TaxID=69332 RepID=A0A388M4V2_CHABU|nr:hypothetical protein CBR_g49290 [Chara braunii]|eukprot:GBG89499.1 hypothetical protein CBR_g49290 [Chara braunii]